MSPSTLPVILETLKTFQVIIHELVMKDYAVNNNCVVQNVPSKHNDEWVTRFVNVEIQH